MPKRAFRILIVEDDPVQAKLAAAVLGGHGFRDIRAVGTAAEGIAQATTADIILLDVQLPDGSGLDVLRRLRERSSRPAVVIVTGHGAEHIAIEALRLGADDYVSKDAGFIDLLPGVVERVRRSVGLREALETAEREVVEAERRSAVGEMTVALHHEINNPLMAALTELTLLREEGPHAPAVARGLEVIQVALERIRDAVKRAGEADAGNRTDYLAGDLKMIDLGAPALESGLHGRAVLATSDPPLRRVMTVLLRRAGFDPEPFASWPELAARLAQPPAPSVVLLAGIAPPAGEEGAITGGPLRRPWALVIAAGPNGGGTIGAGCDLLLPIPFDPATFAEQVVTVAETRRTAK